MPPAAAEAAGDAFLSVSSGFRTTGQGPLRGHRAESVSCSALPRKFACLCSRAAGAHLPSIRDEKTTRRRRPGPRLGAAWVTVLTCDHSGPSPGLHAGVPGPGHRIPGHCRSRARRKTAELILRDGCQSRLLEALVLSLRLGRIRSSSTHTLTRMAAPSCRPRAGPGKKLRFATSRTMHSYYCCREARGVQSGRRTGVSVEPARRHTGFSLDYAVT
ncbi:uncharacterized protein LOC104857783 [Fukomys damarensis]|uniref:uncharacterized protein LOC104857783 n=1 Tax=Fukomys damarensis TaxID=885580 RepID=UPI001455CA79|nr:uncharacterized protein LOC104857783 [Fukomys damarensis]